LPKALNQIRAILPVLLRITAFNVQGQPAHFLPYLDAKRAGLELIQGKVTALLINLGLPHRRTNGALWTADDLPQSHDWSEQ